MFANPHYHHYHQRDRSMAMYAGLLTTIYKRSCVSAGMPLSYLQFNDEGKKTKNTKRCDDHDHRNLIFYQSLSALFVTKNLKFSVLCSTNPPM